MADNVIADAGSGGATFATAEASFSGDTTQIPGSFLFGITGSEGAYTIGAINGDATNGLDVDVTRVGGTVTVDNGGTFAVQAAQSGTWNVTNISGTVSLPTGAATESTLATVETNTDSLTVTGGGVEASALRVTLANDSTGVLSVDDNAGSLTVDNGGTFAVQLTDSGSVVDSNNSTTANLGNGAVFTGTATDVTGHAAVCVTLYSDQASAADGMQFEFCSNNSFGADTDTYSFNMAAGSSRRFQFPVTAQYFRVKYTNGTTPTTDLDIQTILHPTSPGYTSIHTIEDNVSTDRSAELVKAALIAQVNGTGDFIPIQATASGVLKIGGSVTLDANDGVDIGNVDVASSALPTGAATESTLATVETNTDSLAVTGGGVEATALRVTIASDSTGVVSIDDNGAAITVDNGGTFAVQAASAGDVAHDGADSGNPLKIGAKAVSAEATAVATGDRTDLYADLTGKLIVRPHAVPEETVSGVASATGTGDTSTIAAQGAGVRIYVTSLSVANSSSTDAIVEIKDGTTVIWRTAAPGAGGSNLTFDPPLRLTANTALNCASLTAVTTMYFSANGYTGA